MTMTTVRNLSTLPREVLDLILKDFSVLQIKNVRLVCRSLGTAGQLVAFRSIKISKWPPHVERFLELIRTPLIAEKVEEVVWHEYGQYLKPVDYDQVVNGRDIEAAREDLLINREGYLTLLRIIESHRTPNPTTEEGVPRQIHSLSDYPDGFIENAVDDLEFPELFAMIKRLQDQYAVKNRLLLEINALSAMTEGLLSMPNLKRLISRDSQDGGIAKDCPSMPDALDAIRAYFPISDGTYRQIQDSAPSTISPCSGFFLMLQAMAISKSNVDSLVTERPTGLLKSGIGWVNFDEQERQFVEEEKQETVPQSPLLHQWYVKGFANLKKIVLCVDIDDNTRSPRAWDVNRKCKLYRYLETAKNLEHLELSITSAMKEVFSDSSSRSAMDANVLLPRRPMPRLHTLVLENIICSVGTLYMQIILQAHTLEHVTLWKPVLGGQCAKLLDALADSSMRLKSFVLKSPYDDDDQKHAEESFAEVGEAAIPIASNKVLDFVNGVTKVNPYRSRRWIKLSNYQDEDLDNVSNISDISDLSGIDNDNESDYVFDNKEDVDPDGPEFNSDYDFSAEEDDSEEEIAYDDTDMDEDDLDDAQPRASIRSWRMTFTLPAAQSASAQSSSTEVGEDTTLLQPGPPLPASAAEIEVDVMLFSENAAPAQPQAPPDDDEVQFVSERKLREIIEIEDDDIPMSDVRHGGIP